MMKRAIIINSLLVLTTSIPTVNVTECSLVFKYKKIYYSGCTDADSDGVPWCLLKKPIDGNSWGYCNMTTLTTYLADDQGERKDCDVSTNTKTGIVYGCYSNDDQKTYSCNSSGKSVACLIALPGHRSEFRRPPVDAKGYNYSGYPTNLNRTITPDMSSASQADPTAGDAMSLQVILILSILGGLAILSAVVLVIVRRARNKAARLSLEAKLGSSASDKHLINLRSGDSFNFIPSNSSSQIKECTVISTYTPTLSDELVVRPGDRVVVYKIYDDGWVQGANLTRGGAKGVFPLHCIKPLSQSNIIAINNNGRPSSKRSSNSNNNYHH